MEICVAQTPIYMCTNVYQCVPMCTDVYQCVLMCTLFVFAPLPQKVAPESAAPPGAFFMCTNEYQCVLMSTNVY